LISFYSNIHTKPKAAVEEIEALYEALKWAKTQHPNEDDFIMLGDFNASCSYASDNEIEELTISGDEFLWIVPNDADTNQSDKTECAYDRMVTTEGTKSDYGENWGVLTVDDKRVSDHHVVWAEFYSTK